MPSMNILFSLKHIAYCLPHIKKYLPHVIILCILDTTIRSVESYRPAHYSSTTACFLSDICSILFTDCFKLLTSVPLNVTLESSINNTVICRFSMFHFVVFAAFIAFIILVNLFSILQLLYSVHIHNDSELANLLFLDHHPLNVLTFLTSLSFSCNFHDNFYSSYFGCSLIIVRL